MRKLAAVFALLVALPLVGGCDQPPEEPEVDGEPDSAGDESDSADDDPGATDGESESSDGESGETAEAEPNADGEELELAEDLEPGETAHFGEEFTIEDDPVSLTTALERVEQNGAEEASPLKVEARVQQVCQKKGCWFTLESEEVERPIRVRMKDYGFLVSRNTDGADSVVEGTLESKTIDAETARHYAEESDGDPDEIDGPVDTYEFTATGVEMTMPES